MKNRQIHNLNYSLVNWTLLYEWGFYLSLPIISCVLNRKNKLTPMLIFLLPILIYIFHITSLKIYFLFALSYLSTIGSVAIKNMIERFKLSSSILTLTLFICAYNFTNAYSLLQMVLVLLIFIMICNGDDLFGFLKLKGMKVLGDISYSIYLTHGLVLYMSFSVIKIYDFNNGLLSYYIYYPLIVMITILVSFFTYSFIEHPSFKAKKRKDLPQSTF
ncbi:acyltransferase family protein [Pectobacterium betavasculorum]|uniref:acyltransferase family protein n=1 Tax=Pectobacterium betavasculorum TaxID=55207 RepID=UPI003CC7AC8F